MIYDDLHTRLGFRRVDFVKIKTFVGVIFLNLEYLLIVEIYLLFYPQTIETKNIELNSGAVLEHLQFFRKEMQLD